MKMSLKQLILSVALLAVILTLFASTSAGYRMSKNTLIEKTLETNQMYAEKLANTADVFFQMTLQSLAWSSHEIAVYMTENNTGNKLFEETERLKNQTNTFNSVVIVRANGEIVATSPQTLDLVGKFMDSEGGKEALREKRPIVSKPYMSITGRLIIFISYPIFDENEHYIGLVGGSLYLKEENVLNQILGQHYYEDDSYVYVVDQEGYVIYHKNADRINDVVSENPVVQQLMNKQSGAARVVNTENIDMLAGYAYVPAVGWGIVSQRPAAVALVPTTDMMREMIMNAFPYLLLSLVIIVIISQLIAYPLQKLAGFIESSTEKNQSESLSKVKAWYYEAIQLKKALTYSLGFLHEKVDLITEQSHTDPLTALMNRRKMDEYTQDWISNELPFSIVILDIDHFKRVNDTYGHPVGDEVLKFLAGKMREVAREEDICCRYGGEEFVLLLYQMNEQEAYKAAEKLRKAVESTVSPCGDYMTISAGISSYPATTTDLVHLLDTADQCLYKAKKFGRNRCVVGSNR